MTPLITCIKSKYYDLAKLLVKRSANVNLRDYTGSSPLKIASDLELNDFVTLLKENGAKM